MGKMHCFKPNHFVPLVSIISTQSEFRNILVRTQTSLNSSKNIVVTVSSSSSVLSNKFEKPISGVVILKLNVNCENATKEDDCNEFDIGLFVDKVRKLSNQEKRNILLNAWIPPSDYVFPKTNGRKCNPAWFKKFSWLCYSKYYDGLFCISCVLFGKASSTSQLFHEYPFRFWSVGNVRIISHNNTSPMHKTSIQIMLDFQAVISKKTVPINLQLNKFLSDNISRNRQILFSISRAILFCCWQNISLRGHRDDAKHLALQSNNAADKASDVSQTEQMAVVVWYVDECCKVKEDFLKFVSCNSGLTGVLLSTKIKKSIHKLGLEMSYCRGQGYDGVSNMAGRLCGVAALILKDFPKAPYIHCYSHQLNLCVAKACAIPSIRDMMDHVRIVSDFFNNSPKRLVDLSAKIVELCPTLSFQKTINVCRTRWIERIDGLEAFIELYPAIIASLTCIKEDETWNYKSRGDASAYVTICCSFKFIITLIIGRKVLGYTRPLTKTLQNVDQDFSKARDNVENLKNTLLSIRSSNEISHSEWYKEAVTIAATNYILPSKPRTCGQQTQRDNHQVDDISEYYRVTCSIPFLDHILTQLDSLFSLENLTLLDSFAIIPSNLISDKKWRKKSICFFHVMFSSRKTPRNFVTLCLFISTSSIKILGKLWVPVTTCTCERSLSALKRIKTCNSMTDGRLNGISMLHLHRDVEIDLNIVVDEFATAFPRRMKFKNILNSDE
ncbi:52 kDa repressor of the inhibitor of the protein kinase-like [Hydra vulgaris]|uniref:52 kDa repressor of the inhibitor of the protein kinase-like n=1 Tax=Hydra vulgaris TaxID=6087 RepID=UPI0032EA5B3D